MKRKAGRPHVGEKVTLRIANDVLRGVEEEARLSDRSVSGFFQWAARSAVAKIRKERENSEGK